MKMPMMCKRCGGSCCMQRVSFPPKEWEALHKYGNAEQIKAKDFRFVGFGDDGYWYSLNTGACPALTENGCAIPYNERTLLCKLYPYVPFKVQGPDGHVVTELFLATKQCPAWREFGMLREKAEEELNAAQKGK